MDIISLALSIWESPGICNLHFDFWSLDFFCGLGMTQGHFFNVSLIMIYLNTVDYPMFFLLQPTLLDYGHWTPSWHSLVLRPSKSYGVGWKPMILVTAQRQNLSFPFWIWLGLRVLPFNKFLWRTCVLYRRYFCKMFSSHSRFSQ